jgi:ATP-dependent helicase STH1/SNF2
MDIMQAYF